MAFRAMIDGPMSDATTIIYDYCTGPTEGPELPLEVVESCRTDQAMLTEVAPDDFRLMPLNCPWDRIGRCPAALARIATEDEVILRYAGRATAYDRAEYERVLATRPQPTFLGPNGSYVYLCQVTDQHKDGAVDDDATGEATGVSH